MGLASDTRAVTWRGLQRVAFALVGLSLMAGLLVGAMASPAGAHARLIDTNPADDELLDELPEAVELTFDDDVEIASDGIQVIGPDGEDVLDGEPVASDDGMTVTVALDPDLVADESSARGTYSVDWRVTSMDTHVLDGAFIFHVGERTGAADTGSFHDSSLVDETGFVGRWLGFVGSLTVVGAAALAAVARPGPAVRTRLRWLALGGAVVGMLGVGITLVSRVAEAEGRDFVDAFGLLPEAVGDSRSTELMGWRLAFLALAALVAGIPWIWRRAHAAVVGIGFVSFGLASVAGHAWTANPQGLTVAADLAHFGAVSVWIGGIVALLVALPLSDDAGRLARRFSTLAFGAVLVVLPAGLFLAWEHIGGLDDLFSTTYGQTVLAKASLFVVLVALGWLNRSRLVALAERSIVPLRRSVLAEASVAVVVLALTASLVHEPPPRGTGDVAEAEDAEVNGEPFSATVAGESPDPNLVTELQLNVAPGVVGDNELHLFFFDEAGEPLEVLVARAEVALGDGSPRDVDLSVVPPGHAMADDVSLPNPGDWTVTVTARVADSEESVVFTVEVPIT